MRRYTVLVGIALLGALTAAREAEAQSGQGPLAAGLVSAAVTDDETAPSFSGYAGYRFNRVFGLGLEVTSVQALDEPPLFVIAAEARRAFGRFGTTIFPPPYTFADADSDLTVFTTMYASKSPPRHAVSFRTSRPAAGLRISIRVIESSIRRWRSRTH